MKITTKKYKASNRTVWGTADHGFAIAHLYTPHGLARCMVFPPKGTQDAGIVANFIFAGRHYVMWADRPKAFMRLGATRIVRKWIREIVAEYRCETCKHWNVECYGHKPTDHCKDWEAMR